MNYYPLFRVRSRNNGVRCMSFDILILKNFFFWSHVYVAAYLRTGSYATTAPPPPPPPLIISFNAMKSIWQCLELIFFNSIIGQCTEHIPSHYIVPRHIESTILRLSNSWYPTTSTTPNTYIDYWSQADAVQSPWLHVVPSICHWYCVALVCLVLIISRWWGSGQICNS